MQTQSHQSHIEILGEHAPPREPGRVSCVVGARLCVRLVTAVGTVMGRTSLSFETPLQVRVTPP